MTVTITMTMVRLSSVCHAPDFVLPVLHSLPLSNRSEIVLS